MQFHGSCPRLGCRLWGSHTRPCFSTCIILWTWDSQNCVVTQLREQVGMGEQEKWLGREDLSQLCLEMRMLPKCSCALQALPILSFLTLNSLGSVVTDLWTAFGSSNKWINLFWTKWWCLFQSSSTSEGEWLLETPCSDKLLLQQLNKIPSAKKDAHLFLSMQ